LKINDVPVELGSAESPRHVPSFKNTLSDGDRATLAFSLFVVAAEHDARLGQKMIVLDDPFSSHDRARRMYTQQCIRRLGQKSHQVMVLSHDPEFLKLIRDGWPDSGKQCIQLKPIGEKVLLTECDLDEETGSQYYADYGKLQSFVEDDEGEPRAVARCIRPVLEGMLRWLYPTAFAPNEWLGDFIDKIRQANPGNLLAATQALLPELEEINEFSKRYHHDNWQKEAVDPIEVKSFAKRALRFGRP
jgi:wobble nucleotide-excising tRNase